MTVRDPALLRKTARFAAVGLGVFGLDFALLWLFHQVLPPLVAVSLAYLLAVATHFCLSKFWVFQCRRCDYAAQALRYASTVAACWLCNVGSVALALHALTANLYLAKLLAIPPTTLLSFVLMRRFVFGRPLPSERPGNGC